MATQFTQTTRALAQDSARPAHVALGVAVIALSAWTAWFVFGRVTIYETTPHARLESAAAPRDVTALQAGRLTGAGLAVGREVRAGDVLVELDAATDSLMASEERARLDAYPAKISALHSQISALEQAKAADARASDAAARSARARVQEAAAAADFAADNERRLVAQARAGGVAEIDARRAGAEARKAQATRDALSAEAGRLTLAAAAHGRETDAQIDELKRQLAAMEGDATASRSTTQRLQLQADRKTVRAPVDGVVAEALPLKAGAYVAEGQKLATIVPRGDLIVVGEFKPSTALGRIQPGQAARLRLDGYPWAQYGVVDAIVTRVSGEVRDNALRVEFRPSPGGGHGPRLRHGLTGAAEVAVERVSPAQLLLRAAGQSAGVMADAGPKS